MGRSEELRHEQDVVDGLYARLDEVRASTRARLTAVRRQGPSGSPQNRSERDAFASLYEDRLAQLEAVEERLAFGRLDLADGGSRYVGRIGLTDAEHAPLLTDWRAPAAQTFYRATAAHPDGVRRRRHLMTRGRTVTALEDELLDLDAAHDAGTLTGEGALLAAMAAGRTGRMGDIVATIQAEQDAVIRSDLGGALVVQGGPGTGKTAVALHRAAYLLYAHRRRLEGAGVLVVGPSHSFLRYIDQVLPSLGETGVVSATIADLVPGVVAAAEEDPGTAAIKGRPEMAAVVAAAVRARRRVPAADVPVRIDGVDLLIRRRDVRESIARARRTHKPHNLARVTFVRDMLGRLADQYGARVGSALSPEDRAVVLEDLRADRDVRVALNLAWFPLTAEGLIEDLWAKPHRLAEAAPGLSAADRAALARPKGSGWTPADVPLLDEAAELLGEDDGVARAEARAAAAERAANLDYARQVLQSTGTAAYVDAEVLAGRFESGGPRLTTAERAARDRAWAYGHVVVDEAQELSPMAWRMLVRRCPSRSMTIVGDLAQTSAPDGARSWPAMLDPILREWRLAELTVNYRTPAEVADVATAVATAAGLPVSTLTSARAAPDALRIVPAGVDDRIAVAAREARAATSDFTTGGVGRVAIIAAAGQVEAVRRAAGAGDADDVDAPLVTLTPRQAKGLEFDAVVLVEPGAVAAGPGGVADLYVAMTRPTRRLIVIHAEPLPAGLDGPRTKTRL